VIGVAGPPSEKEIMQTNTEMAAQKQSDPAQFVLTLNSGSSSIKFALFRVGPPLERVLTGKFERVGLPDGELSVLDVATSHRERRAIPTPNHAAFVRPLLELLGSRINLSAIRAIGHRVVHGGMRYHTTQRVTDEMLAELRRFSPFVPDHLPSGIMLLEAIGQEYPQVPQVACFDTAFHSDMPRVAKLLPIPRRYDAEAFSAMAFTVCRMPT
jgi:acetate kinase